MLEAAKTEMDKIEILKRMASLASTSRRWRRKADSVLVEYVLSEAISFIPSFTDGD